MIRRPPRSTLDRSSAASDVYKRQGALEAVVEVGDDRVPLEGRGFGADPGNRHEEGRVRDEGGGVAVVGVCLLYTSPSPRDRTRSRMPSSA